MSVKRKVQDDNKLIEFIEKGGSVSTQDGISYKDVRFTLTVPYKICKALDRVRLSMPIKTSRHKWVLEAIIEKLTREKKDYS